jgi:hypothetical protein
MKKSLARAFLLAAVLIAPAAARAVNQPIPMPTPNLPNRSLHSAIDVEVNKKGQVVRIKGGQLSHDSVFDTLTIGNALQMWIRHPDGTAEVGIYRVTYDYDPHTHNIARHIAILSHGGNWANDAGAATKMMDAAHRETQEAYERMKAAEKQREAESAKHLPDINAAVKRALAKPTPSPQP